MSTKVALRVLHPELAAILGAHVVVDGSHFVPRVVLMRGTTDWLDRRLGPTGR